VATNPLGHGSLGVVEEVRRVGGQFPTLVRKRVDLPLPKRKAAAYSKIVQEEARILRSLVRDGEANSRLPSCSLLPRQYPRGRLCVSVWGLETLAADVVIPRIEHAGRVPSLLKSIVSHSPLAT
jgi:hypothetical protein